jgi:transposase
MPFASRRAALRLEAAMERQLTGISKSRTEPRQRVERARILLAYARGETVSAIARGMRTNRPKVERCLNKALQLGPSAALSDLPGRGRPARLTPEDRAWVVSLACQKPKELGYSHELWTTRLLAKHVREHCRESGHSALQRLGRGTVSKILTRRHVRPHKVNYYLERRDSEFEAKMAQVLYVYKEVELMRESGQAGMAAILSYDEKPGIQAIGNTVPDLPPVPGKHPAIGRDHEYVRHGTLSLMAGIDLLSGQVHGHVVERHRSREFIEFLKIVDQAYPSGMTIRVVLDNHSAHLSQETRGYLGTVPGRFEFIFTPKHGSWLNLIENFFAKMAKSMLRGIRVESKAELKERILKYLQEINEAPVIFRWRYGLESISLT